MDALLLGGLIALWLRGPGEKTLLRIARFAFPIALAGVLIAGAVLPWGHIFRHPYDYPAWKFTWGLSAIDLLAALLLLEAIRPRSLVYRVLSLRPMRWLGRISYGAYVWHDIPHSIYGWVRKPYCARASLSAHDYRSGRSSLHGADFMAEFSILGEPIS